MRVDCDLRLLLKKTPFIIARPKISGYIFQVEIKIDGKQKGVKERKKILSSEQALLSCEKLSDCRHIEFF